MGQKVIDYSVFGARLKQLRQTRGLSVSQLADFSLVSQYNLRRYEAGLQYPFLPKIAALADALAVSPSELLKGTYGKTEQDDLAFLSSIYEGPPGRHKHLITVALADFVAYFEGHPALSMANVGRRVRIAREERGITIQEVAAACSIKESSFRQIESGQRYPSLFVLCSLCNLLQASPEYFMKEMLKRRKVQENEWLRRVSALTPLQIDTLAKSARQLQLAGL